jgi:hypothetical protein
VLHTSLGSSKRELHQLWTVANVGWSLPLSVLTPNIETLEAAEASAEVAAVYAVYANVIADATGMGPDDMFNRV